MAILNAAWVLTATVDGHQYMFYYEFKTMEAVLDEFWHDDYPEALADCVHSGEFPITLVCLPNCDGIVGKTFHLMFNTACFDHFFDKGWSASSKEPGERYTLKQFMTDITMHKEKDKVWVFIAEQTADGDVFDTIVETFNSKEAALKHLDNFVNGEEGERQYEEKHGCSIDVDSPDFYRAGDLDNYHYNHTEVQVLERWIKHYNEK